MSINFATLQGLSIPEGVVTQITDASGRVLWMVQTDSGEPAILEVEKITSNTYAAETTYENEQFILLDIYPKTNGTVKVTYGGLTKTIKDTSGAAEPNAQQVFFGTFNGVSDSVATPASGELTIKGDYVGFGVGKYNTSKAMTAYCTCITEICDFGASQIIAEYAFSGCTGLTNVTILDGVTTIGGYAFKDCSALSDLTLPSSLNTIETYAFSQCNNLTSITIPPNVTYVGDGAFATTGNKTLRMLSTTPPQINSINAFGVYRYVTFIVPKGCGNAYKTAKNWNEYVDCIVEAS